MSKCGYYPKPPPPEGYAPRPPSSVPLAPQLTGDDPVQVRTSHGADSMRYAKNFPDKRKRVARQTAKEAFWVILVVLLIAAGAHLTVSLKSVPAEKPKADMEYGIRLFQKCMQAKFYEECGHILEKTISNSKEV